MSFGIRPVRIRIKSGGVEHTTLHSLLDNFSIQDVVDVMDGRLERWLRQQNHEDFADKVARFKNKYGKEGESFRYILEDSDLSTKFLKLFFEEIPSKCKDLSTVSKYFREKKSHSKLVNEIIDISIKRGDCGPLLETDYISYLGRRSNKYRAIFQKKDLQDMSADEKAIYSFTLLSNLDYSSKEYGDAEKWLEEAKDGGSELAQSILNSQWNSERLSKRKKAEEECKDSLDYINPLKKNSNAPIIFNDRPCLMTYKSYYKIVEKFFQLGFNDFEIYLKIYRNNNVANASSRQNIILNFLEMAKDLYEGGRNQLNKYGDDYSTISSCRIMLALMSSEVKRVATLRWISERCGFAKYLLYKLQYYPLVDSEDRFNKFAKENNIPENFLNMDLKKQVEFIVRHLPEIESEWKIK